MRKILALALALAFCLPLAAEEKGKIELPALEHEITGPNHVYGRALDPEDLGQRAVILWNISRFVEPGYNRLKAAESGDDDDDDNNNYRRNNRDDRDREGGPQDQMREESRAIQRASKGAVKDGRLLVIAVDPQPADPELRRFAHLKGNFGTAWQNQQREFDALPAPILFTTNCLMPPRESYRDRVFTTGLVSFPGVAHIGADKDFGPVIAKALALGGYPEDRDFHGVNGGETVTTGFGHGAILAAAPKIVEAVKAGAIRRFFLVGGCDGARPGRNYYTDFVKALPQDTIVLTLACGKFRFNDLDLGTVAGLPRLLDVGQCNDAYGAVRVAVALAEAFGCGVNDLPLSLVLSWYEQKAVCILLTLLHLGIRGIRLGPTLPAFVSPNILALLAEKYAIAPITTPEQDLAAILG